MSDRMRLTGMYSGMDTEAIVQQLVQTKQKKVDDLKGDQKKLEWKQNAWQDLNSKIYNLYSTTLSKLRMSGAFKTRKTTISDPTKATVTATGNALNGTQTLKVNSLAKAGYMTGAKFDTNIKLTSQNNIKGLDPGLVGQTLKIEGMATITKKDGTTVNEMRSKEVTITENMTFDDLINEFKTGDPDSSKSEQSVKFNIDFRFDEENQRFFISSTETGKENDFTVSGSAITKLGLDVNAQYSNNSQCTKQEAKDASITLNGANFESSSNTFNINGLTINAMGVTDENEEISIVTSTDVDGIYDTIKDFFTEYNELINEMDKLYNADSARKYNMLSAEEKEAMTDDEIETWENTIKGSLLRKDTQLSTVMNALTNTMLAGCNVNGKQMYLSDFGIKTTNYFTAKDNEHHSYHIDGDPDDEGVSSEPDKLRKAIMEDPDGVADFFSGLCKNLYKALDTQMKETTDYSSIYKVYNDKQMKKDYDAYTKKIKEAEKKLSDYEDKWYNKFSAMETALSKLQSNQSVVSSMLGN